jgi:chromosome segregation ATPase
MRETPYPLAAVRTQRDHQRQDALTQLGAARTQLRDAETTLHSARAALGDLQRRRSLGLSGSTSLKQVRATDLVRGGAYAARLQGELHKLVAQLRAAEEALQERERAVRLAELNVNDAHAQREVVERHHAQFRATERKLSERAQELEAEELRRHPSRSALRS